MNHSARGSLAVTALAAAAIFSVVAGMTTSRGNGDQTRALLLADRLVAAPAAGVPYILEDLLPVRELAWERLREHVHNAHLDPVARLHAACALADVDVHAQEFLVEAIATAPASECRNLVSSLTAVKSDAAGKLANRVQEAADPAIKARFAIVALQLGDPAPAQALLALGSDPRHRTTFIHTFAQWHGDAGEAAEMLAVCHDEAFRSGLCAALGTLAADECGRAAEVLAALYVQAPDGGTHAAAGWALRQWQRKLPYISPSSRPAADRRWFVNREGMTMLEIAAGTFRMGTAGEPPFDDESPAHEVTLSRPFYLADREVSVEQFLRFVADADCPPQEKPQLWEGYSHPCSPTPDCPVQMLNWFDAVLYCNWLSNREGRQACYQRAGQEPLKVYDGNEEPQDVWRCDFTANGYRLPTEAEWEYAARAGSTAGYCFGEGTTRLQHYAWLLNNADNRTWPGGLKMPNAWGLFDMHGNVWEWCWDLEGRYGVDAVNDPSGPDLGLARLLRGGAAGAGALGCRSAFRYSHRPNYRNPAFGLRVGCGK